MTKHTPTPWKFQNHEVWSTQSCKMIAELNESKSLMFAGEAEANAELIVRAVNSQPELLGLLKDFVSPNTEWSPDYLDKFADIAREVIVKAEGK